MLPFQILGGLINLEQIRSMMRQIIITLILVSSVLSTFAQESKWLRYPSISPDGDQIAFTYQGDIFVTSIDGKSIRQITQHTAHDFKATWSPDGQQIAFASDRHGNFDIYVVAADGGTPKRLTYHSADDLPHCFDPKGEKILFSSARLDNPESMVFPNSRMTELYQVDLNGALPERLLSTPVRDVKFSTDGKSLYYHDKKGYENTWRKHHTSSEARDIWKYDLKSGVHEKLTTFPGEDRNPVPYDGGYYYLSERSGSFNVWKDDGSIKTQITLNKRHPVRFLSISNEGTLCYSFDGDIFTYKNGRSEKVGIQISKDLKENTREVFSQSSGVSQFCVSPNEKEVAFILHGDVFVAAIDYSTTKRITTTTAEERDVSFSKDGSTLIYASERNGNWDIYECTRKRESEKYFYLSTILDEKTIIASEKDEFQPKYSPDSKKVAYLEDRVVIKIYDRDKKNSKTILESRHNYSYKDGDQWFSWSPKGDFLLSGILDINRWVSEIALIDVNEGKVTNLTKSGYYDFHPKWGMGGECMYWFSDRDGLKSHGGWGSLYDVYGMYFSKKAYARHRMTKEEFENWKEDNKNKKDTMPKDVEIEWGGLDKRKVKYTLNSSIISDALLTDDGDKLYYLSKSEDDFELWVHDFYENETKVLCTLGKSGGELQFGKNEKNIYALSSGKIQKIKVSNGDKSSITFSAEFEVDKVEERTYIFDHITQLIRNKFYTEDLHGVDWSYYEKEYKKFLPHISNNYEFTEMLSELLGELNASHTGSRYRSSSHTDDHTASFAFFPDDSYTGSGIKIKEIIPGSPLENGTDKIEVGTVITAINGHKIDKGENYYPLLNMQAGKRVLLSFKTAGKSWDEVIKPITQDQEYGLLYERWIQKNSDYVNEKSNGRLGYVHVKQMNDHAFREVYDEILGKNIDKEALIVDTRWNGGGWLHVDLIDLLNGTKYFEFEPRGKKIGSGPHEKWLKPSAVVMNEGNYSNAHMFPYLYKQLEIGKLIGMPVPGTGTAVWWEWQIDPTIYFGIPQVGIRDLNGEFLENQQLEPDYKISQRPEDIQNGTDSQLDKAIEVLLKN